ncbi:MAG: hypothetical protein HUU50_02190 [Candidatus Brocadiae bacterium]|nr:hypothetical protein [Candidatus Brocadiia bacterium]
MTVLSLDLELALEHTKSYPGIQITPVIAKNGRFSKERKLLWEGMESNSVKIQEKASSSVPEVELVNESEETFIGCKGSIIRGGGQNRQLLHSFVVPKKASIKIPVQCIQHGRWNPHHSRQFSNRSGDVTSSSLKFSKKSQMETWQNITETATHSGTTSMTEDYTITHDFMFGDHREAQTALSSMTSTGMKLEKKREESRERAQKILQETEPIEGQVGVYIHLISPEDWKKGEVKRKEFMEIFASQELYKKVHKDVLTSFVADAAMLPKDEPKIEIPALEKEQFSRFLQKIQQAPWKDKEKIGSEKRQEIVNSSEVFGESIYDEEEMVHLMCSV